MKLLKNISLFLVAVLLCALIYPVAFIYSIIKSVDTARYFYMLAYTKDQSANVVCKHLFNATLVKSGDVFGNPDETISSVMGKNESNLTTLGKILFKLINSIDPGHFEKAKENPRPLEKPY